MENNALEILNKDKAELVSLAEQYKTLEVSGIEDKAGYDKMKAAKKDFQKRRTALKETGLSLRNEANNFAKTVIDIEKEILKIIEPVEDILAEQLAEIDNLKAVERMRELLPIRRAQLEKTDAKPEDDFLLNMDSDEFSEYLSEELSLKLERLERESKQREAEAAEAQAKIERDRAAKEAEKLQKEQLKKAKAEATEKALAKAEKDKEDALVKARLDKEKALEDARRKHEQDLLDQERLQKQQVETERKQKEEAAAAEEAQIAAQQKTENFKEWLVKNGVTAENKKDFHFVTQDGLSTLYRIVDTIRL